MKKQQNNEWEERLSAIIHDVWSHWQKYLHSKCEIKENKVLFSRELFERWERQLTTSFNLLSEEERQSDRDIMKKFYFDFISKVEQRKVEEIREMIKNYLDNELNILKLKKDSLGIWDSIIIYVTETKKELLEKLNKMKENNDNK